MRKCLVFLILLFLGSHSFSQQLLGKWTGISSQQVIGDFYLEMTIDKVQGDTFSGYTTINAVKGSFKGGARIRVTFKKLPNGSFDYKDEGVIDSTGKQLNFYWCKKAGNLVFSQEKDSLVLSGPWTSPSCAPGTIVLKKAVKEKPPGKVAEIKPVVERTVAALPEKPVPPTTETNVKIRGKQLTMQMWDFDAVDEDSVSIKLNGKQIGAKQMMLQSYKIYGSPDATFSLALVSGDNQLEIVAENEGLKPFNTVGLIFSDEFGSQKFFFTLKAKERTVIHFLRI